MAYQRQQNWPNNESGILRKKDETEEELLVFGYSCKLFRDDEKALYIDQGKHLIPWMNDETLRIDRYDVRGALYDLSKYEAVSGQQAELFWVNLSNEEKRIEQLCDEERYRALTHNEDEEALYQEEELKRLHQALGSDKTYGQVSYSYDEENGEAEKPIQEPNQADDSDEPFVPPPELDLPQDMVVPETVKLNAIIEKTAMFIVQQGLQMEIILKMKQATNPQFEFLSYNSSLHSYYRHVLMAIKTGRYRPKIPSNPTENKSNEENASDQNYYLHHSLSQVPSSSLNVAPLIPSINYKPSTDCAYSMLVNKIKGNQNKFNLLNKPIEPSKDLNKGVGTSSLMVVADEKLETDRSVSSSPQIYNPVEVSYESNEENDSENILKSSSPAPVVQRPGRRKRRKRQQGAFAYNDSYNEESVDVPSLEIGTEMDVQQEIEPEVGLEIESVSRMITPPPEIQLIIDKMAGYVAKNGRDFEAIVRSKDDPRFYFLDVSNQYYPYYSQKVEYFEQLSKPSEIITAEDSNTLDNNDTESSVKSYDLNKENNANKNDSNYNSNVIQKPNPVCFSIKRPKETEGLEIKSALPVEESSEDEEGEEGGSNDKDGGENVNNHNKGSAPYDPIEIMDEINASMKNTDEKNTTSNNSSVTSEKWAEERVKDKLAAAAREKLVSKEKEKQLQLERKRRAAAFLNLLQKSTKKSSVSPEKMDIMIGPQLPDDIKTDEKSDSGGDNVNDNENEDENEDSNSVSSPPSSVTSPDVTIIEDTKVSSPSRKEKQFKMLDPSTLSSSLLLNKLKRSKHSSTDKYERSVKSRDSLEYRHKHRKRKRSRSPSRRHRSSHSSRPLAYHSSNTSSRDSKHRKHHRHHKERHRSERSKEYSGSSSSSHLHRRHKHYKSKKHKKKDDKKGVESSTSDVSDSE